jgi:MFS-type transporter involved in bile tolerance (Atg22 family)
MNASVQRRPITGVFCAIGVVISVIIQNIRPFVLETSVLMVILEVLCFSCSRMFRVICFIITSWLPSLPTYDKHSNFC